MVSLMRRPGTFLLLSLWSVWPMGRTPFDNPASFVCSVLIRRDRCFSVSYRPCEK